MTISNTATYSVADQSTASASTSVTVQPAGVVGTATARGRLVHPTLGTYDYVNTPDQTENVDAGVLYGPLWTYTPTLSGGVNSLWNGNLKDALVIERWLQGDVGSPIEHLRALWSFFANPPDPAGAWVVWTPNYCTAQSYRVAIVGVSAGGSNGITIDRWLLSKGYAPQPVELRMRVISAV